MKRLSRATLFLDASCIILLEKIGCLRSLDCVGAPVAVCKGVVEETRLSVDVRENRIRNYPVIKYYYDPSNILPDESLGLGERESIGICLQDKKWRIFVSDDIRAQKKAIKNDVQSIDSRTLLWLMCISGKISISKFCQGVHYSHGSMQF